MQFASNTLASVSSIFRERAGLPVAEPEPVVEQKPVSKKTSKEA